MDKTDMPELEEFYGVLFQEDGAHYYLKDKVIFDNDNFCKLREINQPHSCYYAQSKQMI